MVVVRGSPPAGSTTRPLTSLCPIDSYGSIPQVTHHSRSRELCRIAIQSFPQSSRAPVALSFCSAHRAKQSASSQFGSRQARSLSSGIGPPRQPLARPRWIIRPAGAGSTCGKRPGASPSAAPARRRVRPAPRRRFSPSSWPWSFRWISTLPSASWRTATGSIGRDTDSRGACTSRSAESGSPLWTMS